MSSYVHIGKIQSAQGIKGEIFVMIFSGEAAWADQWDILYWGGKDSTEPEGNTKIVKARTHEKQKKWGFVLKVEDVPDRNEAELWVGRQVYIPEEFLTSEEGEEIYLREVLGFRVKDIDRGDVGEVVGFAGSDFQDLLIIKNDVGEYEIPFVHPIHLETDKDKKELIVDIPEGLVAGEEL